MSRAAEGPREVVIRSARAEPDGVLVEVRDSGPGLPPADVDHVFDAFYTTKPDGMGMGLAIARTIVEAHGGRLWAANLLRGTAFQFTIPISGGPPRVANSRASVS